ncbi:axoneme-associated protein mst101(2)-like isoform X1 [Drosophila nasuta]|uniref:axoneme-associated protein mst101(2)-like isoform X1 n=1 Tax=Drosophila nasuta TaxID=42062 RepID=UPI00295E9381|nr:axoneme-associated protein mst101(2)-like isoform X1 [Drosophila nasuta]
MILDKSCIAPAGHVQFLKNRRVLPVILSAKRFNDIVYRSTMGAKRDKLAAAEEDERYLEYLKKGHDALSKHFTNVGAHSLDEEKQAKLDQELREAEIREKQIRLEDERTRKERIIRANRILEELKPGQRALHHALMESEMIYQRKYNEAVNREILQNAENQQRRDEIECPETLVPASSLTEEELKAKEQVKAIVVRALFLKDIEERRQQKADEKEQEIYEGIVEREQYKCLHEQELKAAKKLAEKRREFCRNAYRESLKEKAAVTKFEKICNKIDDRVICVDNARRRHLDTRYNVAVNTMRNKIIQNREKQAVEVCRQQEASKQQNRKLHEEIVDRYDVEVEMDEARRQCQIEELSKQRRAYQRIEQRQAREKRQKEAEIRRYQIAGRLKNHETNKRFANIQQLRKDKATSELRSTLFGQRDEFLEKQREEKMRMAECQANPYLQEDLNFTNDALKSAKKAREAGRPIYPIAKAVEVYRRKNQLDVEPEGRMVQRSKLRDYCWPGYHSKADLAYRQYEHNEECRQKQESDRNQIFAHCMKITKMAAEEHPYKPCVPSCPVKCFQHRGMPPIDSNNSIDVCREVCYEDHLPIRPCPGSMQLIKSCKMDSQAISNRIDDNCDESLAVNRRSSARISDIDTRDHPFIHVLSNDPHKAALRPSKTYCISRSDRARTWR